MGEFSPARRNGLLLCLQQSSCAAAVGARPKHVAAHGNRNSDGVGARSSPGNLERYNSRARTGSSSFRSDCGTLGYPGPRACTWFAHSPVRTGWFPTGGMVSVGYESLAPLQKLCDIALHIALPMMALVLSAFPVLVRHIRAAIAEVLSTPFLRAAASHGIQRRTLLYRYALRAAANPLISLFGLSMGGLLSGSLIIEVVMSWPGLGPLLLEAILARDLYVVIGGVLCSTIFLIVGNLVADVLLYLADPRIRTEVAAR